MEKAILEMKVENLLNELRDYVETSCLSEREVHILREEIDKLLYECFYYKTKLLS